MANAVIDQLVQQVHDTEGVLDSAVVYVKSVPGLIDTAVQKALANGATAAELAPLTDLSAELKAKGQALSDAIAANPVP